MGVKGFMGPNDYNLESNLAGKGIRLEKREVSFLFSLQVILGSDSIRLPIDEWILLPWEAGWIIFFPYQLILIILSFLKDLLAVLYPNLKQLMFCKLKCIKRVSIRRNLRFPCNEVILKHIFHLKTQGLHVLSLASLNVGIWYSRSTSPFPSWHTFSCLFHWQTVPLHCPWPVPWDAASSFQIVFSFHSSLL